jgi:hypothetical protein
MVGKKSGKALLREEGRDKALESVGNIFDNQNRPGED